MPLPPPLLGGVAGVEGAGVEGAAGAGVEAGAGVVAGAALGAEAAGRGGRRSAGSATTGSATPEAGTEVEGSTNGTGAAGADVPPAVALRTAKAAPNASATSSATIATRPREVAVIRRAWASSNPEPGSAAPW